MPNIEDNSTFFSKGRRGSDSLKLTYIICAILLAMVTIGLPGTLPIWFPIIVMLATGPVWNIIDGFVDDGEQWLTHESEIWNENKIHTYFNWICLGFLSTFALGLCIAAASTQLTALGAGSAVIMGIPVAVFVGPIGSIAFAITMLWLAKKSFEDIKAFSQSIKNEVDPSIKDNLRKQRGYVIVDFFGWLSAGIGATGFAVIACLAFLTVSFPPAIPIIFVSVILLSASIKCYQIFCHPKTPTTNNIPIKTDNNAEQSESLICREEAKNDIRPIQKAAESKITNAQNNEFKLKQ